MKKKQKVKERHVRQLRQLIGAVAEQNGEEGTLPMSLSPLRILITILSVAAVVCGVAVLGRALLVESDFFPALGLVFSTGGFRGSLRCKQGPLWPGTSLRHHICRPSRSSLLLPQIRSLGMETVGDSWK